MIARCLQGKSPKELIVPSPPLLNDHLKCSDCVCWMPLGLVTHMNCQSAVLYLAKRTGILNR